MLLHDPDAAQPPEQGVAFSVSPIGLVHSAHRHTDHGAESMERWTVEIFPRYSEALGGIEAGESVWLLTFHFDPDSRCASAGKGFEAGISQILTVSPSHPVSPIRFTQVKVLGLEGGSMRVEGPGIEDGTPVLDIRSVLCPLATGRAFT